MNGTMSLQYAVEQTRVARCLWGEVKNRLHIGFDDPSEATGTPEFIDSEFHRIRDEINARFYDFYMNELRSQLL